MIVFTFKTKCFKLSYRSLSFSPCCTLLDGDPSLRDPSINKRHSLSTHNRAQKQRVAKTARPFFFHPSRKMLDTRDKVGVHLHRLIRDPSRFDPSLRDPSINERHPLSSHNRAQKQRVAKVTRHLFSQYSRKMLDKTNKNWVH